MNISTQHLYTIYASPYTKYENMDYHYFNNGSWKHKRSEYLYLGSEETYLNIYKNKHIDLDHINTVNKIYIPSTVQYPRVKLTSTDLKRVLNESKADATIIDDSFNDRQRDAEITPVLLYSKKKDIYTLIDRIPKYYNANEQLRWNNKLNNIVVKQHFTNTNVDNFIQVLIDLNVIADDITLVYTGPVFFHSTDILNANAIIDVSDLDIYVNTFMPKMDDEVLNNLSNMFNSNDCETLNLAMKLLCGYDISEYKLRVGCVLQKHCGKLQWENAYKSVQFKQLLSSLNISNLPGLTLVDVYEQIGETGVTNDDSKKAMEYIVKHIEMVINQATAPYKKILEIFKIKLSYQFE